MKNLKIELINTNIGFYPHDFDRFDILKTNLNENEYPEIYLDHEISEDEFNKALDTLITYFMQNNIDKVLVDLDKRNESYKPIKEMTIAEIEKELGHKVKIVKED